jgi:hypothetical protein
MPRVDRADALTARADDRGGRIVYQHRLLTRSWPDTDSLKPEKVANWTVPCPVASENAPSADPSYFKLISRCLQVWLATRYWSYTQTITLAGMTPW